jgi:hypothetical protein
MMQKADRIKTKIRQVVKLVMDEWYSQWCQQLPKASSATLGPGRGKQRGFKNLSFQDFVSEGQEAVIITH